MTPNTLITDIKARFSILLVDDETVLNALMRKALTMYQDKAGFMALYRYDEINATLDLPDDFLARICVKDSRNRFISSVPWVTKKTLELTLTGREIAPLTLTYLVNAHNVDFETWDIPLQAAGIIGDYLELLITMANSERLRRVSIAGKLDTSDIPMHSDLLARRTELESAMALNRAIIPVMGIGG